MARGYAALEALKEPDLFEQATPYLGIYHFIEGNYEQAMNLFSRASRKLRAQEHHLVEMFYVRHWSFAASCRGNFELAAGLLLSGGCACSPRAATTSSPAPYVGSLRRCTCAWGNMKRRWNSWT